jgi:hypothetical protein
VDAMSALITKYLDVLFRHINHMERIHWIGLSVVVLVIGIGCMRTMNSRM